MEADRTPYDERSGSLGSILALLGTDFHVSTKGTSVGTDNFSPKVKTLALIMFYDLYPLTNTKFIITSQAKFPFDLTFGTPIDIYAHIFQTLAKTFVRSAARTCLPFRSLDENTEVKVGSYSIGGYCSCSTWSHFSSVHA